MKEAVEAAYQTTEAYEVRARTHARYSVEAQSFGEWLLEQTPRVRTQHKDSKGTKEHREATHVSAPWAAYQKSCRELAMPPGHTEEEWAGVAEVIGRVVESQFAGGELVAPKVAGVFVGRRARK